MNKTHGWRVLTQAIRTKGNVLVWKTWDGRVMYFGSFFKYQRREFK